jgi:hypothetical protein
MINEYCFYSAVSSSNPEEPKNFQEAWNHPNDNKREKGKMITNDNK